MNEQCTRTQTKRIRRVTSIPDLKISTFVQEISSLVRGRQISGQIITQRCPLQSTRIISQNERWELYEISNHGKPGSLDAEMKLKQTRALRSRGGAGPSSRGWADGPQRSKHCIGESQFSTLWSINRAQAPASASTKHISDLHRCLCKLSKIRENKSYKAVAKYMRKPQIISNLSITLIWADNWKLTGL